MQNPFMIDYNRKNGAGGKIVMKQENNLHFDLPTKKICTGWSYLYHAFHSVVGKIVSTACSGVTGYYSGQCSAVTGEQVEM